MPDPTELTSVTTIKTYLGITSSGSDTLLGVIKTAVEERVKRITGRDFLPATYTEYHDGDGGNLLRTKQRPIISITSIHSDPARLFSDATLIPESDIIDDDAEALRLGFVELLTFKYLKGIKSTKIVYRAGYTTIPQDLAHAVGMIVCREFKVIDKKLFAEQTQQVGDMTITLSTDKWPKDALECVMSHRRIDF